MNWIVDEAVITDTDQIAQDILTKQSGLALLETREWYLPISTLSVDFSLGKYRRYNIIEEYILKCMQAGLAEIQTEQGIIEFLQLDEIFVRRYFLDMINNSLITPIEDTSCYELTEKGRDAIRTGLVPGKPRYENIMTALNGQFHLEYFDIKHINASYESINDSEIFRYCNEQEDEAAIKSFSLTPEEVIRISQQQEKDFQVANIGEEIGEIHAPNLLSKRYFKFGEIWIYDLLEHSIYCRIWDFQRHQLQNSLGDYLKQQEEADRLAAIQKLMEQDTKNQQMTELIRVQNSLPKLKDKPKKVIETLRGHEIREAFLETFKNVKKKLIIISPWISDTVVDSAMLKRFRQVVEKGGVIYIGWGIAKTHEKEDRLPSPELLKTMDNISDKNGNPGVFVYYIGNQHNKEILVDSAYHMLGSFNWLSYRGEYHIRQESVNCIYEPSYVADQQRCLEEIFLDQLEKQLMSKYLQNEANCQRWFKAILNLHEHVDSRQDMCQIAVGQTILFHKPETIIHLVDIYAQADTVEFSFDQLIAHIAQTAPELLENKLSTLKKCYKKYYNCLLASFENMLSSYGISAASVSTPEKNRPRRKKQKGNNIL